ncbi:uncharacterized protein LOC124916626 [Impatiens glandulifera]|uniref:uncharacterized protein LOC124916626 n=1 Tax=Impatiens glandulifera TaxID=253017 RepID=UPI001FB178F0|nr:uncharacterized protein LOC124916626 [Impatiens glandulifera]
MAMEEISLLSHSIFSTFIALYTLLLIYFPYYFFTISLSPLLISFTTTFLFIALLNLKAQTETEPGSSSAGTGENRADPADKDQECVLSEKENELDPRPFCDEPIGWSIGASLEVIYEDYEGEEEEEEEDCFFSKIEGYPSLSLFYPETDSDDDEEDDDDRDEMIEIALNVKGIRDFDHQDDEDENLIEIDIFSPARTPEKIELTGDGQ